MLTWILKFVTLYSSTLVMHDTHCNICIFQPPMRLHVP